MGLILNKNTKAIIFLLILLTVLLFTGCQESETIPPGEKEYQKKYVDFPSKLKVEKNNIANYIDELSSEKYKGRKTGTQGEYEAALYLATYLKELSISPYENSNYFHVFKDPENGIEGENVLGILKKPERHKYIIISAYYDHLGQEPGGQKRIYPGANHNASGVSSIMEIARILSKNFDNLDYNLVFAFWSGHEQNLSGSKNYLESLSQFERDNIEVVINLDVIGSYGEKNYIIWRENDNALKHTEEISNWKEINISPSTRGADNSDHYYFAIENIPAFTIRSEDWAADSGSFGDNRYGVNIENVKLLTQNLVNYIYNLKEEKNV